MIDMRNKCSSCTRSCDHNLCGRCLFQGTRRALFLWASLSSTDLFDRSLLLSSLLHLGYLYSGSADSKSPSQPFLHKHIDTEDCI